MYIVVVVAAVILYFHITHIITYLRVVVSVVFFKFILLVRRYIDFNYIRDSGVRCDGVVEAVDFSSVHRRFSLHALYADKKYSQMSCVGLKNRNRLLERTKSRAHIGNDQTICAQKCVLFSLCGRFEFK